MGPSGLQGHETLLWYPPIVTERRRVPVAEGKATRPKDAPAEPATCECPRLEPGDWDNVESDWGDITFIKAATGAFLGVPTGYDPARIRLIARAREMGATLPQDAMLLLGEGRFRRTMLLEVEGLDDDAPAAFRPGGVAFSQLVQAPWGQMKGAMEKTQHAAREKYGRNPDDTWIWYLTCRICSRERHFETLIIGHYRHEQR